MHFVFMLLYYIYCVSVYIFNSTRRVAVYLETLQYRLEESVSHRRTRQVTQLFT